ncbi:MFS transporter [Actinomadura barringtoniae]|uniref:MFS transporter n=1 Tax=Actinomadura barringtoniae TaxID=1427535 RepID=A0A939T296_9ACTN|nr:MFS transporter [Actinomadura barringtoniae]
MKIVNVTALDDTSPTTATEPSSRVAAFLQPRVGGFPRSFWTLWAGTLLNRLGTMVEPFLGLYLTTARGLSLGEAGIVMAIFGTGSIVGQLIGGSMADRIGRRATLSFSMVATGLSMLALGYAQSVPAVVAAAVALGLTIDMYRPASDAMVADLISPAERPRAYGLLFWAINLGFTFSMVLGGTLARQGYLTLFWIDAVTCVLFGVLVWRALPETRPDKSKDDGEPGGFKDVLRDRLMVACTLTMLAYTFVLMQCMTTMPLAMKEQGLGPASYGVVIAVNGIVIVTVQPLVGAWLSRMNHSLVLSVGMAVVGVGFGMFAFATSLWAYATIVLIWTIGEITVAAVAKALVADLAPPHLRGRYGGLWGMAWSAGFLLAPLGGTRLLEIGAPALWLTCGALGLVAGLSQWMLAPAIRRRADFSSH